MRHIFCVSLQKEFITLVLSQSEVGEFVGCFYQESATGDPRACSGCQVINIHMDLNPCFPFPPACFLPQTIKDCH